MDNPENLATHTHIYIYIYTRRRKTKQKQNTICIGRHYTQTNTNNVNKTWALLQTTEGKDKPNILNKTWALLQTTEGKDKPNIVIMCFSSQRSGNAPYYFRLNWCYLNSKESSSCSNGGNYFVTLIKNPVMNEEMAGL